MLSFPELLEPVELQVEVTRLRQSSNDTVRGVAVRVPPDRTDDRATLAEVARTLGHRRSDMRFRVLLVDDNALVASMYTAALRRLSNTEHVPALDVEVASDGGAAFDRLLRPPRVDFLVTDVFMPVLSGISLVEKIRAEPSLAGLPVVVITSGGDPERERLAELGISLFLEKPVSYQDIAAALDTLFSAHAPGARGARLSKEAATTGVGAETRSQRARLRSNAPFLPLRGGNVADWPASGGTFHIS